MGALYRPGPLSAGLTDSFIKRKNGLEDVQFAHPLMKGALETTFGVLVYQEQVMQISRDVCGFTGGEADTLRKAIGKKKVDVMKKMQIKFEDGAVANGVPRPVIEKFWKDLLGFADYCFNKSHSACYGMISYQTAYLKAHYPAAFMAALMTSDYDDTDRLAIEIAECKKMGIRVLPPDVNESFVEFAVVPDADNPDNRLADIRFGMNAIKNVGTGAVEEILRARKETGSFADLEQFLSTVSPRIVNRKAMESLIKAGAFDRFADRSKLLHNLDMMLAFAQRLQKEANSGQVDLFGGSDEVVVERAKLDLQSPTEVYDTREQLLWERELLGLYLSQHPLEMFETYLAEQCTPLKELKPEHDGRVVSVGGSIADVREIMTKNGKKMAFVKLEDNTGEIEVILFPNALQQTLGLWERDKVVLIRGRVNAKDRDGTLSSEAKVMVDDAREITVQQATAYQATGKKQKVPKPNTKLTSAMPGPGAKAVTEPEGPKRLYIRLENSQDQAQLTSLKQTLDTFRGSTEVVLVLGSADARQAIKLPTGIDSDSDAVFRLRELVGADNIRLQ
jgi:DNA polymerase-3 subunit alpha